MEPTREPGAQPTTELVYSWKPATDEYQAAQVDPEVELKKGLEELRKNSASEPLVEKKAPVAIRLLIWYYFLRAGLYALLLVVISGAPQWSASIWLQENLGSYLRLPTSSGKQIEEARKQMEAEAAARGYQINFSPDEEKELQEQEQQADANAREMVKVYLAFSVLVSAWVGFMWWNHSWRIRWITMFYAGAFVAKAALNGVLGFSLGVGIGQTPGESASMLLMVGVNGFIFCYLAFWPGVKAHFEPED
jgi:hypothetical protein